VRRQWFQRAKKFGGDQDSKRCNGELHVQQPKTRSHGSKKKSERRPPSRVLGQRKKVKKKNSERQKKTRLSKRGLDTGPGKGTNRRTTILRRSIVSKDQSTVANKKNRVQ